MLILDSLLRYTCREDEALVVDTDSLVCLGLPEAEAAIRIFAPGGAITQMWMYTVCHTWEETELGSAWELSLLDCYIQLAKKHGLPVYRVRSNHRGAVGGFRVLEMRCL